MDCIKRKICVAALLALTVEAFIVTTRSPSQSLTRSFRPSQIHVPNRTIGRTGGSRTPGVQAPRMSDYEEGSTYDSEGKQYETQELIVDFTDDGRILLEVKGVKGPECRQITEELIKNLGDVIHTENTAEYFEEKVTNKNVEKESNQLGWSYDASKPEW